MHRESAGPPQTLDIASTDVDQQSGGTDQLLQKSGANNQVHSVRLSVCDHVWSDRLLASKVDSQAKVAPRSQRPARAGTVALQAWRRSPHMYPGIPGSTSQSHPWVSSRGVAGAVPSIPRVPTCLPVMTWQVELGSQYRTLKLARQDIHKLNVVTVRSDACCLPQSPNFPKSHPIVDGSCPLI